MRAILSVSQFYYISYLFNLLFLIYLTFFEPIAIQDLCILTNGVVLSCAFDKRVIVWNYLSEKMITYHERSELLRCMDFIDTKKQKKLYVGTDKGVILLIDIALELDIDIFEEAEASNQMNDVIEEEKENYEEGMEQNPISDAHAKLLKEH